MLDDRTKAWIREYNPAWDGRGEEVPPLKRLLVATIEKYLPAKQILAITGLRRVGKTVVLKQLLKEMPDKKNVLYFLFDDLLAQKPDVLEDIIDYFLKTIAGDGRKYLLLDEIHKVPAWQDVLNRYYVTRDNVKMVITGSASLNLRHAKESLAGRLFDFYLPILSFREFLTLNGIAMEQATLERTRLQRIYEENLPRRAVMEKMVNEYIFKGAFPELATQEDAGIIQNYIRNAVIDKVVLGDIPQVFEVRKHDILYALLEYCAKDTAGLIEFTNLTKMLGVNYQTIKTYMQYLETAFLIDLVPNTDLTPGASPAKPLRKKKKVHVAHPAITITLQRFSREILAVDDVMGRYVETIVFQHARTLASRVSFYSTPQHEEIDMVVGTTPPLPIEVKYRARIDGKDLRTLVKFQTKFTLPLGIVVTRDTFEARELDAGKGMVLLLPLWLFLLVA